MSTEETKTEHVEQGPRWPTLAVIVVAAIGVAALSTFGQTATPPTSTTSSSTTSTSTTVPTTEETPTPRPSFPGEAELGVAVISFPAQTLDPNVDGVGLVVSENTFSPGALSFWRVDLGAGVATRLPGSDIRLEEEPNQPEASVRVFGDDRVVVVLGDHELVVLSVDDLGVRVERELDFGTRILLGTDFIDERGESVWVRSDSGYLRWRLSDDKVLGRWFDLDGNLADAPRPVAVVDGDDLLVMAGSTPFLIDDAAVTELSLPGNPVAANGQWIVTSECDASLRCGRLGVVSIESDGVASPDPLSQRRASCGAIATDDDRLLLVVQQGASATLLEVDSAEIVRDIALYPSNRGCIDVHSLGEERIVVSSRRGLTLVGDATVTQIPLEATGGLVATGW